ncbi:hypothetical protein Tsubulata_025598 [Turnera subulata]|uniref:BTB domain-containing protein n=1 Tax=Turnera subulata TaxID=218843 RepID=A0A9Q0FR41_9ROSI|nr:hypothetical protein Tsubulata_025598 [Turnera subulata]
MRTSSKHGGGGGSNAHIQTLHHRLYHALNLGTRYSGQGKDWKWKWKSTDIEIQRLVVRSIASFLDSISPAAAASSHHPLVKESVADIVGALGWILHYKSEAVVSMAANLASKLVATIPYSIMQPYLLDLVHPLSSLLLTPQLEVSISCASSLNVILSNLSALKERSAWEIMVEAKTVNNVVNGLRQFSDSSMSIECFHEMATLLSAILYRWPSSRHSVWNDAELMKMLFVMHAQPDFPAKAAILKLYAGVALCGLGAKKLLENGESLLQMMVICMDRSQSISVRIGGFRLAQCLLTNRQGSLKLLGSSWKPFLDAIVDGMSEWKSCSDKISDDQMTLMIEACRLALITRWAGEHHDYLWKHGIARVLLDLILQGFQDEASPHSLSLEGQMSKAKEVLSADFLLVLRPYIWNILGWLAIHCRESFNADMLSYELHISMLITCACLSFTDLIRKGCQICQNDTAVTFKNEAISKAVLMMIYSPCKYIASRSAFVLSEILKPTDKEYLKHLLQSINLASSRNNFGVSDLIQTELHLVVMACYSSFPHYQRQIIEAGGVKALMAFIRWGLSTNIHIGRLTITPDVCNMFCRKTCCIVHKEDWEGDDAVLLYCFWCLAELIHSGSVCNNLDYLLAEADYSEAQFINTLQDICCGTSSPGLKWYAAHILSYFGIYGFPSILGARIGQAVDETEFADMQFIFSTGHHVSVHGAVIAFRCPSLLPPEEFNFNENLPDGSSVNSDTNKQSLSLLKRIHLSSHVDQVSFCKLLDFVYSGYLDVGEELLKKLKILAKRCNLQGLLVMLNRRRPKWGEPFIKYDLGQALGSTAHHYSDIILEAKEARSGSWPCGFCSLSQPHIHAHKVVLQSSCDYFRALFQSGMLESHSQIIKIPVGWEAMIKLVNWFYTAELPNPACGCLWDHMDTEERLRVLQPFLELCWLSEVWFLEEVYNISHRVVITGMDAERLLSIDVIKVAAEFSLWELAEVAANHLAPLYRQLCDSGALESLSEELMEMIRAASVQLSQGGIQGSSR